MLLEATEPSLVKNGKINTSQTFLPVSGLACPHTEKVGNGLPDRPFKQSCISAFFFLCEEKARWCYFQGVLQKYEESYN